MVSERANAILSAAIREFIHTGDPVSSGSLYEKYQFGIRPARIRAELNRLTAEGYLDQPYHSAGRIPTDRGFEFFAHQVLDGGYTIPRFAERCAHLLSQGAWEDLLGLMSEELGILGAVHENEELMRKEGLEELVTRVDWSSPQRIQEIIHDFEALDVRLGELAEDFEKDTVHVFVGKQSPITSSDQLAVVAGDFQHQGSKVMIVAIGPKRMDYQKVIGTFIGIKHA